MLSTITLNDSNHLESDEKINVKTTEKDDVLENIGNDLLLDLDDDIPNCYKKSKHIINDSFYKTVEKFDKKFDDEIVVDIESGDEVESNVDKNTNNSIKFCDGDEEDGVGSDTDCVNVSYAGNKKKDDDVAVTFIQEQIPGTLVPTKCSFCKANQTNHYCRRKVLGSNICIEGTAEHICGKAYCIKCRMSWGEPEDFVNRCIKHHVIKDVVSSPKKIGANNQNNNVDKKRKKSIDSPTTRNVHIRVTRKQSKKK